MCGNVNPNTATAFAISEKDAVHVCSIQTRPFLVNQMALQAKAAGENDNFSSHANVLLRPFLVPADRLQLSRKGAKGYYGSIKSKAGGNAERRLKFRAYLPRDTSTSENACMIMRIKEEGEKGIFLNFENQC